MANTFASVVVRSLIAASLAAAARPAHAQIYEAVGTRAQGMGGAFVAVADDATATWWNPAGLATGAYFSSVIERARLSDPENAATAGPGRRDSSTSFAATFPSLGISYYRLRISEIRPSSSTGGTAADRQDQGAAGTDLRSIALSRYGVTFGQSVSRHLVIASTLSLVHGGSAAASEAASGDALDHADELDVPSATHGDIDLGAMIAAGSLRLGLGVKHVAQPEFGEGADAFVLKRQARAGAAFVLAGKGSGSLTLASDVDLTRTPTVNGDVKHVAGGAEFWFPTRRLGLRGGVSANLVGSARTSTSAGVSLATKSGLYLDGAWTFGDDQTRSGWGFALRVTF